MLIVFFMHAFCLVSLWKTCCACIMQPFLSMISSNIHSFCVHSLILCKIYHTNRRASFPFPLCVCLIVHQKYGSQCSVKHFIVYLFLYMLAVCIYILNSQLAFFCLQMVAGRSFSPLSSLINKRLPLLRRTFPLLPLYFLHWSIQSHELIVLHFSLTVFTLSKYRNTTLLF